MRAVSVRRFTVSLLATTLMGVASVHARAQSEDDLAAKLRALEQSNPQVYAEFVRRLNAAPKKARTAANAAGLPLPTRAAAPASLPALAHKQIGPTSSVKARHVLPHTVLPPGITRAEFEAALRSGGLPTGLSRSALEKFISSVETVEAGQALAAGMPGSMAPGLPSIRGNAIGRPDLNTGMAGGSTGNASTALPGGMPTRSSFAKSTTSSQRIRAARYGFKAQISASDVERAAIAGLNTADTSPHVGFSPHTPGVSSLLGMRSGIIANAMSHAGMSQGASLPTSLQSGSMMAGAGMAAVSGAGSAASYGGAMGSISPAGGMGAYGAGAAAMGGMLPTHRFGHGYFSSLVQAGAAAAQQAMPSAMRQPIVTRLGAKSRGAAALIATQMMSGEMQNPSARPLLTSTNRNSMTRLMTASVISPGLGISSAYRSGFERAMLSEGSVSGGWLLQPTMFGSPDLVTYNLDPSLLAERKMDAQYYSLQIYGGQSQSLMQMFMGLQPGMGAGMSGMPGGARLGAGYGLNMGASQMLGISPTNVYAADRLRQLMDLSTTPQDAAAGSVLDEVLSSGVR